MGMNHPPLYEDKDEEKVFKQAMMWLKHRGIDGPLAHWLYHWCEERGKERFKDADQTLASKAE